MTEPFIIIQASKKDLYPAFGRANSKERIIHVRIDLPPSVYNFIVEHEVYHLDDKAKFWLWREIKANLYGAYKHPIGFLRCAWLSLAPYRILFYIKRFKEGR